MSKQAVVCGPECGYRRLYEGSQASLNAMVATQTQTFARVAALRDGVLHVLKSVYPARYTEAEERIGQRLSVVDDRVLLAFLESFVRAGARPAPSAPTGVAALRTALEGAGFTLPAGDDLAQWAAAVRRPVPATATSPTPPAAPAPAATPATAPADGRAGAAVDAAPWDAPAPEDMAGPPTWDLADLFDDAGTTPAPQVPADELFDQLYEQAERGHAQQTAPEPPTHAPEQALAPTHAAQPAGVAEPAAPAVEAPPVPVETQPAPAADSDQATGQVLKPQMFPPSQVPRTAKARRTGAKAARVTAAAPGDPAPVATDRFAELFEKVASPWPVFVSDLVAASGSPGLVAAWEEHCRDQGNDSPVRFITPRAHHRDRGALALPRGGGLREKAAGVGRTVWAECLEDAPGRTRLRGARLYEVAVLLARYGSDVVSYKLRTDVLSLRITTPAGLTGVVMWVGTEAPTGSGREHLAAAIEDMITDRLVLLAVLTHEGGDRALDRLASVVSEDAAARSWQPTMPVVVSHSWDFAGDGGASALAVL